LATTKPPDLVAGGEGNRLPSFSFLSLRAASGPRFQKNPAQLLAFNVVSDRNFIVKLNYEISTGPQDIPGPESLVHLQQWRDGFRLPTALSRPVLAPWLWGRRQPFKPISMPAKN